MFKIIEEKESKTVIEKSKFFSFCFNCNNTDEQQRILKKVKKENLSATHVCFGCAFYDGQNILCYSSDDREPSGTAGLQILNAIKENDFVNTLCVVVRYFGGIKLGVPGLSKAYKESALKVLIENKKEVELKELFEIKVDYTNFSYLKTYFDKEKIQIMNLDFKGDVIFNCFLNHFQKEKIQDRCISIINQKKKEYC